MRLCVWNLDGFMASWAFSHMTILFRVQNSAVAQDHYPWRVVPCPGLSSHGFFPGSPSLKLAESFPVITKCAFPTFSPHPMSFYLMQRSTDSSILASLRSLLCFQAPCWLRNFFFFHLSLAKLPNLFCPHFYKSKALQLHLWHGYQFVCS